MYILEGIMNSDKKNQGKADVDAKQALVAAYDRIVDRMIKTGLSSADKSAAALKKLVEDAVELEQAAEEMTGDEMHLLSQYIYRDLELLGSYLHETGEGLASWLNFDLNILEQSVKQQVMHLADQTIVENIELNEKLECNAVQYLSGELCGAGTLRCLSCNEQKQILKTVIIEPCHNCQSNYFERISK
jgi:hypothetical protein